MGCNYNDIIQVTNSIGLTPKDKKSITKMEQLKNIEKLETQLRQAQNQLDKAENEQRKMTPHTTAQTVLQSGGWVGGLVAGGYAGVKLGGAIAAAGASTGIGALPGAIAGVAVTLGCAFGGMYLGVTGGEEAGKLFDTEDTGKQRTNANNYNEKVVKPLEAKVTQIEKQLEAAKNKFYDEQ